MHDVEHIDVAVRPGGNLVMEKTTIVVPDLANQEWPLYIQYVQLKKVIIPCPCCQQKSTLRSFLPRAIILRNDLPRDIHRTTSLEKFKTQLKFHLNIM